MRRLVPDFILLKTKEGSFSGCFRAIAVNIDLIGFTELTQMAMQHSHAGVEALIDTINAIFEPAITALESRGGFIAGFAGDAFTALFEEDCWLEAFSAAWEIKKITAAQEWQKTEFGSFKLEVRIGIGKGDIAWEIVPALQQHVFWFSGPGIDKAAGAQINAQSNEVYFCSEPEPEFLNSICSFELMDGQYCLLSGLKHSSLQTEPPKERPKQDAFVMESLFLLQGEGEFRDLLSCFVNLNSADQTQCRFVIETALAYGGYISHIDCTDKGWVMFVIFGAPLCYDRYQLSALDFALQAQTRCGSKIRIGLSEGKAYAGFVGSQSRGEYTGMGKAVNLAARFMMKAAWGEVRFDAAQLKSVGNAYRYNSLGTHKYKGYPQAIETYSLLGKKLGAEYSSFDNRFLGRQLELERLIASCAALFKGRFSGVSYLYGAAGQGKSRLIHELKQKLSKDVRFITLQSDSIQRIALGPFQGWIRSEFTKDLQATQEERITEFRSNWAKLIEAFSMQPDRDSITGELKRIESAIAGLIGLEWEGSVYSQLEPQIKATVTGFAIKSLIEMLGKLKPVILILEDLHWLDQESAAMLKLLTRKASSIPFKLIVSSRLGDDGSKPELILDTEVKVYRIFLDGLNRVSVCELMEELLSRPVSEELLSYVHTRSLGNPFIAAQLSIYLLETGRLEISDNTYQLRELAEDMPESVEAVLIARIDRLETDLKRMVHTASVLGCEFSTTILEAMLEAPHTRSSFTQDLFDHNLRLGEIQHIWNAVSELSYIFSHGLLRDAAYGMQLIKQIRRLHLLAAEAMQRYYADDKVWFSKIAFHYEKADAKGLAAEFYLKAGAFEKELFHFTAALDYYCIAEKLILEIKGNSHQDYARCLSRIGMVHWGKSEYELALSYFERALLIFKKSGGEDSSDLADTLHNLGSYYYVKGDYGKALENYQKALSIQRLTLGEIHPDTASSLNCLGNVYKDQGDLNKAQELYEQALAIWQTLWGDKHPRIATSYNCIADVYWNRGNYKQAMNFYEQALSIRQETLGEKHPETAIGYNCIGDIYSQTGHFDKAIESYQKALSIRLEILGNRHTQTADSLNNLGIVYDITGEYDKALKSLEQALKIKQEIFGDLNVEVASILNNIGGVHDHQGNYDLALQQHEKALKVWLAMLGEKYPETASCLNNIGCAYENKGENDKALGYYEKALAIYLEVLGEKRFETSTALVNIGCIHENKRDFLIALSYYSRALAIRKEVLGTDHPATQRTQNNVTRLEETIAAKA
jgi:tetratricopeptide (TPR) repeat protein/class 3 adenylate cyclase